jgi:4-amino-4-deoxy-L-arabinose transferase-like glycosyltransferase
VTPTPATSRAAIGAAITGALAGSLVLVVLAWAVRWLAPANPGVLAWLTPIGWMAAPLLGAAVALLLAAVRLTPAARVGPIGVATLLALSAAAVVLLQTPLSSLESRRPQSPQAIARSILRWAYRSPATVAQILPYSTHPNPVVREQAVLALGVNMIVTDMERVGGSLPSRYAHHPLRDSLRARLLAALSDSSEAVRAEAARALWKAPRTFGPQPEAAETLAAVLDRVRTRGSVERLAWLALDAAAGARDSGLKAAAGRLAAATMDSDLRRAAVRASR